MYYKKLNSGDIIKAKVTAIKPYGAFIETRDGRAGLIHISEITNCFVFDINSYVKVDEIIEVKVLSVKNNKINATLNYKPKNHKKSNNGLENLNLFYGFETLKMNMEQWKKKAFLEMEKCE